VAILIVAALVLLRRRSGQEHAARAWRMAAVPALDAARLARELLLSASGEADDPTQRAAVDQQVDRAAEALDRVVASASNDDDRAAAAATVQALRGLSFALEADRLLHAGTRAPTADQLAKADQSRRDRAVELDEALSRLTARVGSGSARRDEPSAPV
jgi:hypothetical protein